MRPQGGALRELPCAAARPRPDGSPDAATPKARDPATPPGFPSCPSDAKDIPAAPARAAPVAPVRPADAGGLDPGEGGRPVVAGQTPPWARHEYWDICAAFRAYPRSTVVRPSSSAPREVERTPTTPPTHPPTVSWRAPDSANSDLVPRSRPARSTGTGGSQTSLCSRVSQLHSAPLPVVGDGGAAATPRLARHVELPRAGAPPSPAISGNRPGRLREEAWFRRPSPARRSDNARKPVPRARTAPRPWVARRSLRGRGGWDARQPLTGPPGCARRPSPQQVARSRDTAPTPPAPPARSPPSALGRRAARNREREDAPQGRPVMAEVFSFSVPLCRVIVSDLEVRQPPLGK